MAFNPNFRVKALTYIDDLRYGALVNALKGIDESDDEARDKAITEALIEIGGIAPASYHEFCEKAGG